MVRLARRLALTCADPRFKIAMTTIDSQARASVAADFFRQVP